MREVHEYSCYQARVRQPLPLYLPRRLWGKWVRVVQWTEYEREWLVKKFEEQFWAVECRGAALNQRFEIEGRDREDDDWEAVSEWRRAELRQAEDVATALRSEKGGEVAAWERGQPGRPAGLGVGVLVRHIRDVEGIKNYDLVLSVLDVSGIGGVQSWLQHWGVEARRRIVELNAENIKAHESSCAYCHGSAMPSRLREAIDGVKSQSK